MSDELNEELDSQNQETEEVLNTDDIEETDAQSETEDNSPKYTELEMKLHARAKKAEAEARRLKAEMKQKQEVKSEIKSDPQPRESSVDIDVKILTATKGYDEDAIDELKFIAERKGISLFAAEQDARFVRYQQIAAEDKKKAEAGLGASKGAGHKKSEPDITTSGLTPEQHKKLWEKKMGL